MSDLIAVFGKDGLNVREMTSVERVSNREYNESVKRAKAAERHRPLSASEVDSLIAENQRKSQIQSLAVDDATAVRMRDFYPAWHDLIGQTASVGMKFTHEGELYEVNQEHTYQADWIPGQGTESMYRLIPELYEGDEYDPIPYKGNMALESGKYYTQDDVMYKCVRDTGNPVYNALKDLVGLYVEAVDA